MVGTEYMDDVWQINGERVAWGLGDISAGERR